MLAKCVDTLQFVKTIQWKGNTYHLYRSETGHLWRTDPDHPGMLFDKEGNRGSFFPDEPGAKDRVMAEALKQGGPLCN